MSSIEKLSDLIAYMACSLVDEPDDVRVDTVEEDRAIVFELSVGDGDLGKVIGREGRTARAMRSILAASSANLRKRAILDILE